MVGGGGAVSPREQCYPGPSDSGDSVTPEQRMLSTSQTYSRNPGAVCLCSGLGSMNF